MIHDSTNIMINLNLTIGNIRITPLFWSLTIGFVISAFLFWRFFKAEDLEDEEIYKLTLNILFSAVLMEILTYKLLNISAIGSVVGAVAMIILYFHNRRNIIWDGFESLTIPIFVMNIFRGIGMFLNFSRIIFLGYVVLGVLGIFFSIWMRKKYRSFAWYKSGKPGLVFWASCVFATVGQFAIEILNTHTLYLNYIIYPLILAGSLGVIIYRSEFKKK